MFRRPARRPGPQLPSGEITLQEPPSLPEAGGMDASSMLMMLPMIAMSAMMAMALPLAKPQLRYVMVAVMAVAIGGSLIGSLAQGHNQRKRKLRGARRDYLRYLGQMRRSVRRAAQQQAEAMLWNHPDPSALWSIAGGRRMWERRPAHGDYGEVRLGRGAQNLSVSLVPPASRPVEDLEPIALRALRGFLDAYRVVPDLPIVMRGLDFARILIRRTQQGESAPADEWRRAPGAVGAPKLRLTKERLSTEAIDQPVQALVRSVLAQLTTFHSPDELQVVLCASAQRQPAWDWLKWLPHALHPTESDGAGNRRLVAETISDLERLLGGQFLDRPRFEDAAPVSKDDPWIVIILDGVSVPLTSRLAGSGMRNCTVIDVGDTLSWSADAVTLRLRVDREQLQLVSTDTTGKESTSPLCRPDLLPIPTARALARRLSPFRIGASVESVNPMARNFDLTTLLGIGDPNTFEIDAARAQRSRWDYLRIPIGITESGSPVELDFKEAAQGGMGPHGMLIGATGSGKSELLRTLVLALAIRHRSDALNFVLVDFKGGATFLGCEKLPHTSAVITNLSDELPLVDRMQEALQGELVRRQELLRAAGFASVRDYTRARATDSRDLPPLPTLLIIVDEFSELLASKREFLDLFVMIGRLGRSLAVHLLLASQRIDEGRMHALESHLSYRIGLRTFSAMESRSVIGVPHAYELPSAPGNGYLRTDTTNLIRFKAAYVSAPYRVDTPQQRQREVQRQLVPYILGFVEHSEPAAESVPVQAPAEADDVDPAEGSGTTTLMDIILDRLQDAGPQAHQVWLPPLHEPPSMDALLPPLVKDDTYGITARLLDTMPREAAAGYYRTLCVPVGIIDRPAEQRRDPLVADLNGAGGHVGIAGGPQAGKSTLLRSLILGLALTHTPQEVQIFALDFGGGTLSTLTDLPHLGSVASRVDRERVARTIAETRSLLAERERRFAAHGIDSMGTYRDRLRNGSLAPDLDDGFCDLFLVVDGWGTLRQEFEDLEAGFSELATNGLNYGIHLAVTATRWSEIRPWLRDLLGTRFELHLGDAVESEVNMRLAANVPAIPGRGLTREGTHFLGAVPRIDGTHSAEQLGEATRAAAAELAAAWTGSQSPPVRLLPTALDHATLPAPEAGPRIAIGVDEENLAPVWHDFAHTPHLMIIGDTESGKTNLLRLVAEAVVRANTPDEARIIVADSRRDLYDAVPADHQLGYAVSAGALEELLDPAVKVLTERLPGADISPERLRQQDWWEGPKLFVLVDDYNLLASTNGLGGGPLASLVPLLAHGDAIGLHLVVSRASAGISRAVLSDPVIRQLWDVGSPAVVFSYDRDEGSFFGNVKPAKLPAGRGRLVTRRRAPVLLQAGYLPPVGAALAR
jgi:S-DNA-T family DNA segregation ATPase FtsK/SpoIIIE